MARAPIKRWFAARRTEVLRAGEYELHIETLRRGTRSEGRIGRLYRHGAEVPGRGGDEIDAGTVRFVHLGDARPYLWSQSGWSVAS